MATHTHTHEFGKSHYRSWMGGAVLVTLGLALFAEQFLRLDLVWLVLPGLALVFLAAGVAARSAGLLVSGSILGGLSLGIFGILYPFRALAEPAQGGLFLLALAAGFAFITPLTALVTRRAHWSALVVATVLGLVGGALLTGEIGLRALEMAAKAWPLMLVAIGASLIVRRR
jgi:hypothetical protein